MPIEKIKNMVDSYPDRIEGIGEQLAGLDHQINEYQQEQDALQQVLEQIYEEVVTGFLVPSCDFLYRGNNFYSGSGIGNINSNIENWQAYRLVENPSLGTNYYDVSSSPPVEKSYNEDFTPYESITIDESSISEKYEEFAVTIDYIHHPVGLTGLYGIKGNITTLQNARGVLLNTKQKFTECEKRLKRFGEQ